MAYGKHVSALEVIKKEITDAQKGSIMTAALFESEYRKAAKVVTLIRKDFVDTEVIKASSLSQTKIDDINAKSASGITTTNLLKPQRDYLLILLMGLYHQ